MEFLDGLRGYAIGGVFTAHLCHAYGVPLPRYLHFIGNGVTLFYVLSAYCLMISLYRCKGGSQWTNYALRRYFRIAPGFYIALVVWALIRLSYGTPISYANVLLSALFVNAWVPQFVHSAIPHGWSVGVETTFYALLPWLFVRVRDVRTALYALGVLTPLCVLASWALPAIVGVVFPGSDLSLIGGYTMYWPPSQLPVFLFGILAYLITAGRCTLGRLIRDTVRSHRLASYSAVVLVCLGSGYLSGRVYHIGYAAAFATLLVLLEGYPLRMFTNRCVTSLGSISYGTYLFHQCAIDVVKAMIPSADDHTRAIMALFVAGGLAVCCGALSFIVIEKPGIAFGRRVSEWLCGAPAKTGS